MTELQAEMDEKQRALDEMSEQMNTQKTLSEHSYKQLETTLRNEMYVSRQTSKRIMSLPAIRTKRYI